MGAFEEQIDVGDVKQVRKRKKKHELIRDQELEDIRVLLKLPSGRRFLWNLLSKCKIFETISNHDSLRMAIASGNRDIGLSLIAEINEADRDGFFNLMKESKKGL